MRFTIVELACALAMTAAAAPQGGLLGGLSGSSGANTGSNNRFPSIPSTTTIEQASNVCGSNTRLSCCNEANTSGDAVSEASGLLAGVLGGLGGVGQGGLGLFNGCSKLDVAGGAFSHVAIMNFKLTNPAIGAADFLNSQCKQTAACCQDVKDGGQVRSSTVRHLVLH